MPWFASATRVIPYTINEYPAYSVILGDLHGHYLSYAFFLIGAFLLIDLFFPQKEGSIEPLVAKSAFLGVLLGHLYLTNSWDVLTLALLGGVIVLGIAYRLSNKFEDLSKLVPWLQSLGLYIVLPIVLLSIPQFLGSRSYYLPPVGGVGFNTVYSSVFDLFKLFGQFFIVGAVASALLFFLAKKSPLQQLLKRPTIFLPILFVILGLVLILTVEFFYAKDVFSVLNSPYARTNTVFKIYFHVWAFLCSGVFSFYFATSTAVMSKYKKTYWLIPLQLVVIAVMAIMSTYPYIAVSQYLVPKHDTLLKERFTSEEMNDGYTYIASLHPDDYALITYMEKLPYSSILEVVNYDSYSYNARISAYTGNTTVTGWPLHNVQWYNGYDGKGISTKNGKSELIEIAQRVTDVEKMYTSADESEVSQLLAKYGVGYVVFSDQERFWAEKDNKELNEVVYEKLCKTAWQEGNAMLYDCR
jgi:uncharacterized membrane protein